MRVVLDTNILLQSIPRKSKIRPVWDAFLSQEIRLIVTPSILLEYEEIIAGKTSTQVSANIISLISEAVNSIFIHIYYEWNVIFPRVNIINGDQFIDIIQNNDH
jgi:predicted nucleic acid-binding protein